MKNNKKEIKNKLSNYIKVLFIYITMVLTIAVVGFFQQQSPRPENKQKKNPVVKPSKKTFTKVDPPGEDKLILGEKVYKQKQRLHKIHMIQVKKQKELERKKQLERERQQRIEAEKKRKAELAARERQRQQDLKKRKVEQSSGEKMIFNVSAYIAMCKEQCSGISATGIDVTKTMYHQGHRIVACDPSVIPFHSVLRIAGLDGTFICEDSGGAIKGRKLDVLTDSTSWAAQWGRRNVEVTILRRGGS